jgi:dimethylaniline monooxygenase (N-oxide forming)
MAPSVAVIGAGPLGLMALKNLKDDGFEVHGFERRDWAGGLWKQSFDSSLSVTANTVFNTSRFRAAISDYPFPDEVDDFPTADQIWRYMEDYCDHFGLRPTIRFGADVKNFSRQNGRWAVDYIKNGTKYTDHFDKLVISPGSFVVPRIPELKDVDKFHGDQLHAVRFPDPSQFKDKNVLIVGFHATAQDLVVELAPHAKKAFLSHKNGLVMVSLLGETGVFWQILMSGSRRFRATTRMAWSMIKPRICCFSLSSSICQVGCPVSGMLSLTIS